MKTIKKTELHFQQGSSNKVYNVYLVELRRNQYLVNFEYGRYGSTLREGTKTSSPIVLEEAQKIYDSLVVSKMNKHYTLVSGYNAMSQEEKKERQSLSSEAYKTLLVSRLKRASEERLRKVDNYHVSRLIYRAGQLKLEEAKGYIVTLYATSSEEDNAFYYSVAWALGRYRDKSLRRTIESLREKLHDSSRYIVEEALFLLRDEAEGKEIETLTLPLPFRVSLKNEKLKQFVEQVKLLDEMVASTYQRYKSIEAWYREDKKAVKDELDPLLAQADELFLKLYIYASIDRFKYKALLAVIRYLPINEFNFSLFRRLYKMAEMRDDHAMLAQLTTKIESEKMACYEIYEWNRENRRSLGCSRLYFKKRSLRYLSALAVHERESYLELAKEILLSLNHYPKAFAPFSREYYDGDWNVQHKKYDAYAVHLTAIYLLYGAGKRYRLASSRKIWEIEHENIVNEHRPEMHKNLWDAHPEVALEVLARSEVEVVQAFSFAVVEEHPEVITQAPLEMLLPMLDAPFEKARKLFFTLLKERYEKRGEQEIVEKALLSSDDEVALFALAVIRKKPEMLHNKGVLIDALFVSSKEIFNHLMPLLKELNKPQRLVDELVEKLIKTPLPLEPKIKRRMIETLRALYRGLEVHHLEKMMEAAELSERHLIASKLIRSPEFGGLVLPLRLKEQIASYDNPSMLATTIYLLGKLSDDELMLEYEMLIAFLYHEEESVSSEAMKILKSLAADEMRAKSILQAVVERSFRTTEEQTANNVLHLVESLSIAYDVVGIDQLYRLLIAKSKLALRIGNLLLQKQKAENFSVVQWVKLAKNSNKSVRTWAYNAYRNYPKKVGEAMPNSLMIFDTDWEDTRRFAMDYFRTFEPLSSDDMVVIADSNHNDVQQFAKRMIMERDFNQELMLRKLSEHPAVTIQRFVTDLMLVGLSVKELLGLERFFNTLLHSVNQNRVAKTRVIEILSKHLHHREIAEMVARLAGEHSLSMVWEDKSVYSETMMKISEQYPDIALPLVIEPLEIKEVSDGV